MEHKYWNIVIGTMLAFTVCHAATETNGTDNVVMASTNEVSEVTNVPVEEVQETPEKRDKLDLIIGIGLVAAPEYGDYIDDVYNAAGYINLDDVSGWLDLYLGVEYRPVEQFGIILGGDLWLNGGVDATGGALDETYANAIFIPSLYGQFYFTKSRTFYINGGINFPIPDTGSDNFEFESDGFGFGANIGVEIADIIRIEGGYVSVPVKVKASSSNLVLPNFSKEYDFGGAQIRLLLAF